MSELEERHDRAMQQWSNMKSAHEVAVKACNAAERAYKQAKVARDQAQVACDAAYQVAVEARNQMQESER